MTVLSSSCTFNVRKSLDNFFNSNTRRILTTIYTNQNITYTIPTLFFEITRIILDEIQNMNGLEKKIVTAQIESVQDPSLYTNNGPTVTMNDEIDNDINDVLQQRIINKYLLATLITHKERVHKKEFN